MIIAIVFAELWGVIQLIVLGSFARTVRVRTVFMAVAVGLYACAPLSVAMEASWIYAASWLTGTPAYQLMKIAAYTADPFVEEAVKVLPVVVLLTVPAIRRQWSITDCVLVSAATGAGFDLAEALYRHGAVSSSAVWNTSFGGWMLPGIVATPTVPGPWTTVTSWLPPGVLPNELVTLSLNHYPTVNLHLAWSAVGGLAAGLIWLRRDAIGRVAGVLLLTYVAVDHAVSNAHISTGALVLRNLLALMPIVALGIAWWCDRRSQISSDEPRFAAEKSASWRTLGTLQVAVGRLPWSLFWLSDFVRMRRASNAAQAAGPGDTDGLRATLVDARDRIARDLTRPASPPWPSIAGTGRRLVSALRQPAVIVWLALMTPPVLWFAVGGWPQTAVVQEMMAGPLAWKAVLGLSVITQAWLAWQVVSAVRAWPITRRLPRADDAAMAGLQTACGIGAVALGACAVTRGLAGLSPQRSLLSNLHSLEAFDTAPALAALQLANAATAGAPPSAPKAVKTEPRAGTEPSASQQGQKSDLSHAIEAAVSNDARSANAQSADDAPEVTPDELAKWASDGDTDDRVEEAVRRLDERFLPEKAARSATRADETYREVHEKYLRDLDAARAADAAARAADPNADVHAANDVQAAAEAAERALSERAAAAHALADAERAYAQAHDEYDAAMAAARAADHAARAANPDATPHAAADVNAAFADIVPTLEKARADAKKRVSAADPNKP